MAQRGWALSHSKRAFDLVFSVAGIAITGPLWVVIALLISLGDRGSVFYRARRVGRQGRPFELLKFRTMVPRADAIGGWSTADDDPRITRHLVHRDDRQPA